MQEDIRISVCIPTYNKYETIEYTILSVINQSYQNWELLIIDDSNNSHTEKVVDKFSTVDSRVKYLKNKERLGLVKNWNECIRKANFEYVYILHHDDFLMPNVFQAYNDFAKENPKCGLIHSNCYYITLPHYIKKLGITQDKPLLEKGDDVIEKILFNNNLACSSIMVNKECYDQLGLFDENAWLSPDWEMWARIGKCYDLGHLDIIGCSVVLDNTNTHLSGTEVNEFYLQRKYYHKKIISYFSEDFRQANPDIELKAELYLKNMIGGLAIHYANMLNFKLAKDYLEKSGQHTNTIFIKTLLRSSLRYYYYYFLKKTINYKQAFFLTFGNIK